MSAPHPLTPAAIPAIPAAVGAIAPAASSAVIDDEDDYTSQPLVDDMAIHGRRRV